MTKADIGTGLDAIVPLDLALLNCKRHQMKIHTVHGATGVKLHVREYGRPTGVPILLIHGWSQSHLCWSKQYESALKDDLRMVALDLRGHGMSDAPAEADQCTDGDKWARAFWRTRRAPVRTTFRPTLRQFVDFCAPASSSQFRRTISRKFWPST